MLALLTGCGGTGEVKAILNEATIEDQLPETPSKSFETMEDARYALYEQELGACRMYYEAYSICDSTQYEEEFGASEKIKELCNNKRAEMYEAVSEKLAANITAIIDDTRDCPDIDTYISAVVDDCVEFYGDLHSLEDNEDIDAAYADILKNYANSDNAVADNMIYYCQNAFINAVVEITRRNAECDDGEIKVYLNNNTLLINALNSRYNGIDSERAEQINWNNYILYERLTNSVDSDDEKDFEDITTLIRKNKGYVRG